MLGADQKDWLKLSLKNSDAAWKVLGSSVPMLQFGFDTSIKGGSIDGILWSDSWDGYPVELKEITAFIRDENIANIVSLSGDRHAHFAGLVPSYDENNTAGKGVIAEFICGDTASTLRIPVKIAP